MWIQYFTCEEKHVICNNHITCECLFLHVYYDCEIWQGNGNNCHKPLLFSHELKFPHVNTIIHMWRETLHVQKLQINMSCCFCNCNCDMWQGNGNNCHQLLLFFMWVKICVESTIIHMRETFQVQNSQFNITVTCKLWHVKLTFELFFHIHGTCNHLEIHFFACNNWPFSHFHWFKT